MSKDLTTAIHELAGIDGTIPRTMFEPMSAYDDRLDDDVMLRIDGDTITVGYIAHDPEQQDFFADDEGDGDYREFRRGDDPDEIMKSIRDEGKIALFVQCYEHGAVHYSVAGSRQYPDHQWDVGLRGIHTPCDDVQKKYQELKSTKGDDVALQHVVDDVNATLNEYSKVCNGEVYGIVTETWQIEGQHVRAIDHESCWGFIGSEHALDELAETMPQKDDAEMAPSM